MLITSRSLLLLNRSIYGQTAATRPGDGNARGVDMRQRQNRVQELRAEVRVKLGRSNGFSQGLVIALSKDLCQDRLVFFLYRTCAEVNMTNFVYLFKLGFSPIDLFYL
jgi:hypothetical protein